MKTCYVMVGLPGVGKSTIVHDMIDMDPDAFVYSTDNYIDQYAKDNNTTYNEVFSDVIKTATTQMDSYLNIAIYHGQNIIWDQTNLSERKRKKIVDLVKKHGYYVVCLYIKMNDTIEWHNRLNSRPGKTIPSHILNMMNSTMVEPSLNEGFDDIEIIDMV